MQLFTTVKNLQNLRSLEKLKGKAFAFIPTMGALHPGHLSLIELGKRHADLVVCSIFVNPAQFNNPEDLFKYPRMLEQDANLLEKSNCDVLFVPILSEIYPSGLDTNVDIDLGILDQVMEGEFRPGHFKGMLQVVKRLLDIVQPECLMMGQKDFQQFSLVNHMIHQLKLPVKLFVGETLREQDGLAMSSRNLRLSPAMRLKAAWIYNGLLSVRDSIGNRPIPEIKIKFSQILIENQLKPEYLQIVDGNTLQQVEDPKNHEYIVACIAAWAGDVRLIDNLILKGSLK